MRKQLVSTLCGLALLALAAPASYAHDGVGTHLGLGVGVGTPSGLTLEYAMNRDSSLEGAFGVEPFDNAGTYFHLVYKIDYMRLGLGSSMTLPFYIGLGGFLFNHDRALDASSDWGVRAPVGVSFDLTNSRFQGFAEADLGVTLAPEGPEMSHRTFWIGGYGGVRYWF